MEKILCPIDFSDVSLNGLEYAAQLTQALNGSLVLLYVRTSIWPEAAQLHHIAKESDQDILFRLELFSTKVQEEFNIQCHFQLEPTTLSFEEYVTTQVLGVDLIVMGTNGADSYYQYVFGTHSFHIIEKSKCPVIIIPKNTIFQPIRRIVYAYDPETNPIFLIEQLKRLALPFEASIHVLHISEHKPTKEFENKLRILQSAVLVRAPKGIDWSFSFVYSKDVLYLINQYFEGSNTNLLAMSFHHRSLLDNLFRENTIKKASAMANYPMFVFWK